MAAVSHVGFGLRNDSLPRNVSDGLCLIRKFRLDRIYRIGDSAIVIFWHFGLELPIQAHF